MNKIRLSPGERGAFERGAFENSETKTKRRGLSNVHDIMNRIEKNKIIVF